MDYSVFYANIIFHYGLSFGGIMLFLGFVAYNIFLFAKKYIRNRTVSLVFNAVFGLFAFIALVYFTVPFIRDIPNIKNRNYIIATGTSVGWDNGGTRPSIRSFDFLKDDGEMIKLHVFYGPVNKGERFEIIYLPYSKIGDIVRKLE
jgi:hypothetical protein